MISSRTSTTTTSTTRHRCLVSSNVQGYFEELIDDAQEAILSMLGQRTLLQALTELEIREHCFQYFLF
jgi:hypothetical protein